MKSGTVWLIVILVVFSGVVVMVKYNRISALDEKVVTAWTPLEGGLSERYDSLPKLMGSIAAYVGHDIPDDDALAAAYPAFANARTIEERAKAANRIEDLAQKLKQTVVVRYPGISESNEVNAAVNFFDASGAKLNGVLPPYNTAATAYNTYIRQFPENIIADAFGFAGSYVYIQMQQ